MEKWDLPFPDADICFAGAIAGVAVVGASSVESCARAVDTWTAANSISTVYACEADAA